MVLAELGSKLTAALRKMADATIISEEVRLWEFMLPIHTRRRLS
jgi:hypothetical protein